LELRCNLLDGHCWNIEEPLRNNFALGVIEVLCRIADAERLGIGLPKRVPSCCALYHSLVVRRTGWPRSSFDLDTSDAFNWVAIASLHVRRPKAANVKSDFEVPHALTVPPAC
jgi:hypothetical protein